MKNYEINNNTMALIFNNYKTIIYEKNCRYIVDDLPNKIIKRSCEFFGSSYKGRVEGTKFLMGINYKSPLIIEESNEIIFFPTASPRINECSWIRNKYILNYRRFAKNKCELMFINGEKIVINYSFETIDNQILRSSRLESIIRYRKSNNFV